MKKYYERIVDKLLEDKLNSSGAVLIVGPKWCGKSTTAMQFSKRNIFMQDIETREQNINLAKNSPSFFLSGEKPILIDEWQIIPFIWDAIRFEVDKSGEFGNYILTGSATPLDASKISHSGVGRITTLFMRPMSLYESKDSNGAYSLKGLFENSYPSGATSNKTIFEYAFLTCRGGRPLSINQSEKVSLSISRNYYDSLIFENNFNNFTFDRDKYKATLRSLARNIGTSSSIKTLIDDVKASDELSISDTTISNYINYLKEIFVIEDMPAWSPSLRSKTAIRTSPTRYFIDPSIATVSLGVGPKDLINDLKTFGFLFESLAIRDLRIYAQANDGEVYHYRDKNDFEIDAIVHLRNGSWGAIEIKLNDSDQIEKACQNLLKFKNNINTEKMKEPSFLAVITASKNGYRREDGVFIIPLDCLKD